MASQELQNYVNNIGKYIASHNGVIELESIDALYKASKVALFTEKDIEYGLRCTQKAKELVAQRCQMQVGKSIWDIEQYALYNHQPIKEIDLFYEILLNETFYNFESYMFYLEKRRMQEKRFYLPRKGTLHIVCEDLMNLENNKFKFYGLSCPPRCGKSTINIFFLSWIMMKNPNSHSAMGGHSGMLAKGFYKELLNLITSNEYTFAEIYNFWHPSKVMVRDKSAEEFTITLDEPDRFATVTCRGIDGTWTGAVDISSDGYLYVDDLIRDREHSLSPARMENTYQEYLNKMVDRKNDGAKELMVGTRWSVQDPLGRIAQENASNPNYFFRVIPALNENGESNYDYPRIGFSTAYYKEIKERLDDAEWCAKYQQAPYIREGLLFHKEELRYFDGVVPDGERSSVAVCDPAFGGGDSLSMPICLDFGGNRKYIVDWIFNKGTQKVTVPRIVDKIVQHHITDLTIEKNNGGQLLGDSVKQELARRGIAHCKLNMVSAPNRMSKEDKITGYSDYVKDNFIFLMPNNAMPDDDFPRYKRTDEYQKAIDEMCIYSAQGKNPHDDAPDSITQLAMKFENKRNGEIEVVHNPFRGMW